MEPASWLFVYTCGVSEDSQKHLTDTVNGAGDECKVIADIEGSN